MYTLLGRESLTEPINILTPSPPMETTWRSLYSPTSLKLFLSNIKFLLFK